MSPRYLALILVLIAGATWWILREDPETRVRNAHLDLARLLSKTEGESGTASILAARALQDMFAQTCEVSGAAGELTGSYSPEEMAATVVRVRGLFHTIDLSFSELTIEFAAPDDAIAQFTATLNGTGVTEEAEEVMERRGVTSRMRKVDDSWLFSEFRFAESAEN